MAKQGMRGSTSAPLLYDQRGNPTSSSSSRAGSQSSTFRPAPPSPRSVPNTVPTATCMFDCYHCIH
jgi:hypothetical protein